MVWERSFHGTYDVVRSYLVEEAQSRANCAGGGDCLQIRRMERVRYRLDVTLPKAIITPEQTILLSSLQLIAARILLQPTPDHKRPKPTMLISCSRVTRRYIAIRKTTISLGFRRTLDYIINSKALICSASSMETDSNIHPVLLNCTPTLCDTC